MGTHGHREGSITHWGLWEVTRGGTAGVGSWGEITWGEMPDIGDGEEGSKPHCHVCTYATILQDAGCAHAPQSPNTIKKGKEKDKGILKR